MKVTVKEFIALLQNEEQNKELVFSGLDFFRLKDRGEIIQVEFNQVVYKDDNTGKVIIENQ